MAKQFLSFIVVHSDERRTYHFENVLYELLKLLKHYEKQLQ